jgi:ATP-binding cassette subfamily B protein
MRARRARAVMPRWYRRDVSEGVDPHDEEVLGKAYDARLMRRLLGYVRPYRGMAAGAVGLIVLSSLLQLVGPLVVGVALDLFVEQRSAGTSGASRAVAAALARAGWQVEPGRGLLVAALVYLGAIVLSFGVLYAQSFLMQWMGQRILADLRAEIFAHLQALPVQFFDRSPVGRLVTRVTTDVDALNELFTAGLVAIFGDIVLLAGIVGVLFWLNWRLALVTFAILPLLVMLTAWFKARARESFREVRVRIARINAFLQEHITGMSVVQLFGRERRALDDFEGINDAHRVANVKAIVYYAIFYPGVELIEALGLGLILWYGGLRVLSTSSPAAAGEPLAAGAAVVTGALSVGALVSFLQYAQRFYQPLADLSDKYNILQAAMASSERIFRLLDTAPKIVAPPEAFAPATVRGDVAFEDVRFSYVPGEPVLRGLSFHAAPGETLAVVGHTGAGKSTLANLLLRFYDVDSGSVRLDGVDVRDWDLERLRRSVAIVLQDVFLFSGTVAGNLRLGETAIDDATLRAAAREVNAAPFIERLPGGYGAVVRERGAGLSVGQKQLLAFARALAFDPRVLILDEATASIDTETEQLIQAALGRLLAGRTSIVIAHRLSTIQRADRILVLHRGELREQGTHQELLQRRGIYHRLYRLQFERSAGSAEVAARA